MGLTCQYAKIYKKNFTTKKTMFLFEASLSMTLNKRKKNVGNASISKKEGRRQTTLHTSLFVACPIMLP